jgi:hypothetical protein
VGAGVSEGGVVGASFERVELASLAREGVAGIGGRLVVLRPGKEPLVSSHRRGRGRYYVIHRPAGRLYPAGK